MVMAAKSVTPPLRMRKHMPRLSSQGLYCRPRRDAPPVRRLAGNGSNGPAGDGRHGLDQMTGLRIPIKCLRYFPDSPGELRSGLGDRPGDLWQSFLCQGRNCSGRHWKQFAGRHADQRKKLLRGFIF
jgi:hypothetical protein